MRNLILTLIFVLCFFESIGQNSSQKKYYENRSSFLLMENPEPIQNNVIDSICKTFQVTKHQKIKGITYYRFKVGPEYFSFRPFDQKIDIDTSIFIKPLNKTFQKGDSLYAKGFLVLATGGKKMSKKFSLFLLSAFLQETNPIYANNPKNFLELPLKSNKELWKRSFINMGYGMSYALNENPYIVGRKLGIGTFYILEALHYIPIFGGPFIGETNKVKLEISAVGLASLLFWKTVFCVLIIGKPTIRDYNRLARLKYKTPKSMVY